MSWAMATGAGLGRASKTGYRDSSTNNAIGSSIPDYMQKLMNPVNLGDPTEGVQQAAQLMAEPQRPVDPGLATYTDGENLSYKNQDVVENTPVKKTFLNGEAATAARYGLTQ